MRRRCEISDHALLRYIERVLGYDVEGLRAEIQRQVRPAVEVGASSIRADGFVYRIQGDIVVTVYRIGSQDIHGPRAKRGKARRG